MKFPILAKKNFIKNKTRSAILLNYSYIYNIFKKKNF